MSKQDVYASWRLLIPIFGIIFLIFMAFGGGYLGMSASKVEKTDYLLAITEIKEASTKHEDHADSKFDLLLREIGNIRSLVCQLKEVNCVDRL